MKKISLVLVSFFLSFSVFAELQGEMEAFKIMNGKDGEERVVATDAINGDIIEYVITYKNTSDELLTNVSIKGNIHESTDYIKGSETKNPAPVYSLDGKMWSKKPTIKTIKNGEILTVAAPIESYTGIKWDVESFEGNTVKVFKYRVKVKED